MGFYDSETRNRRLLSLLGGFLLHIVIGTVYITGNISLYIASYLQYHGENIKVQDINIILPLQVVGTTLSLLLGSYLTHRYNPWLYPPHRTVAIGNSIVVLSVFLTSFLKTYALIVLIYGLLFGLGVGITVIFTQYTTPLLISWSHFPQYKGRISGVIVSGFGFGSSIFNFVSTAMINPDNKKADTKYHGDKYFDSDVSKRLPEVLRWLALMYLILSVIGLALLTRPKKKEENEELIEKQDDECPSIQAGVKTKMFWILFVMALCSVTPGIFVLSSYKTFGKDKINNDEFLTTVGAVSSVFNGTFRYLWGLIMDRTSFKLSYMIMLSVQTVLIVTLYYIAEVKALYLIWISLIVCCEGGHFSLFPTIIARMYGKMMGSKIYGVFFYCFGLGAVLGFLITLVFTGIIGYQGLFWILGGLSVVSGVMVFFLFKEENLWVKVKDIKNMVDLKSGDVSRDEIYN
jgi:MFS transporter, OFA family, oxalate/formate antiporter